MVIGHLLPIAFSPLSFSPEGEMQVTPDIDNQQLRVTNPSPTGEVRWG